MKKLIFFGCLILSALSLHARAIQEDYRVADEKARVSYASGLLIGLNLQETGMEFNYSAFTEGLKAAFGDNEAQLSEQEAIEIVETALQAAAEKKAEEERLKEAEFLAKNSERPDMQITPSGLQYEIIVDADGEKPRADSVVRVNYTGSFIDGRLFDSSAEEGGAYIPLERVIPGWAEGLMLMSAGSEYKFYIPSDLAYGKEGIQSIIPPYSTLIFTVELLEIVSGGDQEAPEETEESES